MNKLDNILKLGYQFKLSKNDSQMVTGSIVKLLTGEEVVLSRDDMQGVYHSSIIDANLSDCNTLLVSYYRENGIYEAVIKKNTDNRTMILADGNSFYEAMNKLTNYLLWFYSDYEKIYSLIDSKLNNGYNMILTGDTKGFVKKKVRNKPFVKLEDSSFFSMFENIDYELNNEETLSLEVSKKDKEYSIKLYDLDQPAPNSTIKSDDLLGGLAIVNRNIRKEKGKVLCKKRY